MGGELKRRIDVAGPVGPAIADTVRDLLAAAAQSLDRSSRERARNVHDARKALKAVRSHLRLVRPAISGRSYRAVNAGARDAARALARARDGQALREAVDLLAAKLGDAHAPDIDALRQAAERLIDTAAGEDALAGSTDEVHALVARCIGEVSDWRLPAGKLDPYLEGLGATYGAARSGLKAALASGDADELHEARKPVIHWRYQLDLVSDIWPAMMKPEVRELQALRQVLGDHNDLVLLRRRIHGRAPGFDDLKGARAVCDAIDVLCRALRRKARRASRRLFAEPAEARIDRLAAAWKAARRS